MPDRTTTDANTGEAEQAGRRELAITEKRVIRQTAEAEVQRLLDLLDRLDGDPDLEDGGDDEPSLGFTLPGRGVLSSSEPCDDRELDDSEQEPSLASPETVTTDLGPSYGGGLPDSIWRTREGAQTAWAKGNTSELEGDAREDDEDGHDREDDPSELDAGLGWTETLDQDALAYARIGPAVPIEEGEREHRPSDAYLMRLHARRPLKPHPRRALSVNNVLGFDGTPFRVDAKGRPLNPIPVITRTDGGTP